MQPSSSPPTLGQVVAARRKALGLSLKALASMVVKDDGHGVSPQYLLDIERDRRIPSPGVLRELARAVGVDDDYLQAVAGVALPEMRTYLSDHPEATAALVRLFAGARKAGFSDWASLLVDSAKEPGPA